ncbi:uncharacterized protein LOC123473961 isoform X2 [Daphnia magna]|uniref:uncharacterized protein LOC123473961 isoform X2 n=1 Tax=Daphnia magna TaxID=35525 RepID=UPI001E1BD430|nr:uncharacterized protein LOC123473961 isoform X2 [Daphnia magna]
MAFQISTSSEKMADAEQPEPAEDFLFKGKRLDCKNNFFGKGFFLFDGYWKENENAGAEKERVKLKAPNLKKEVAIRRIKNEDCLDGWKDVADKLVKGNLNHNNILRVFGYEEDVANGWRYFALEPYSATLYEYCNGKYKGAMPNESQVLYQITNGVSYLHDKGIVHGDLNPLNVVIAAQSLPVRMKISDFGLSKFSYSKQLSEKGENISFKVKLCLRKYWTLSEETNSVEGIKDIPKDVIAAGCILFYYLTRGKHLFGNDSKSILINLKEKYPVNLEKLGENHFAYEPIKNMINPPGKGFNWLHIAKKEFKKALSRKSRIYVSFQVNTGKLLGSGTFGDVFEGKFNGDLVAVKQMTTTTSQKEIIQREMNTHIELNHVNVVKLLDVADSADNRFTHLALELCGGTLADYCKEKYSGPELPPDELVLYQIANGLHYIHSRNLVHRDIKPENILISMTSPVQMKVSDFSFVEKTRDDMFSQSKIRGSLLWMAPEILMLLIDPENMPAELPDGTIKSDTFSSGCVFFYFLTRGKHPFGKNQATVPGNILENKQEEMVSYKQNLAADDVDGRILAGLIEKMIQFEEERIGLPEVIKQLAAVLYGMGKNSTASFENELIMLAILLFLFLDKSKCQLRLVDVSLSGDYRIRSHPTEPILACANKIGVIFYTAENSSIPFARWKKKVTCVPQNLAWRTLESLEWNINGTQLAVGDASGTLVIWNYPECEDLFRWKLPVCVHEIEWNAFRHNLLATFQDDGYQVFLCDSSNGDKITINTEDVGAVKWISENRIAVSSLKGKIKIFEMDENNLTTTRLIKQFTHEHYCCYLEWNERTRYLVSGGGGRINIWSMDRDTHIYSLKTRVEKRRSFAWRPCTGNGEEEGGIEMARKSAKNFTFVCASIGKGVFIWNSLEIEPKPRRLSEDTDLQTLAFSSDGRFLVAGGNKKLIIWSAEEWVQIYKLNNKEMDFDVKNMSFFTTKSTNLYEKKLIVNFRQGIHLKSSIVLECVFEESNISDSGSEISTESDDEDDEDDDVSPVVELGPPSCWEGSSKTPKGVIHLNRN